MRVRLLPIAVLAFILTQAIDVFAQGAEATPLDPGTSRSAIYIGPVFGYNRSIHSVNLASFASDPLCPYFTNGSSNGFYAGLSFEQHFGKVNSKHSIIARVLYNSLPASLKTTGDTYPSLVESKVGDSTIYTVVNSSTEHTIDVKYNLLTVEAMYKFNVVKTFGLTIGPTFDFPISKTKDQRFSLLEPNNVQFVKDQAAVDRGEIKYADNDRTIIVSEGDIPESSSLRVGIKAGVQYEIYMSERWYLVPAVYYNFAITNVTSAEDWKVNAFQAGVDLRIAF
jgi:hypothetical protein